MRDDNIVLCDDWRRMHRDDSIVLCDDGRGMHRDDIVLCDDRRGMHRDDIVLCDDGRGMHRDDIVLCDGGRGMLRFNPKWDMHWLRTKQNREWFASKACSQNSGFSFGSFKYISAII